MSEMRSKSSGLPADQKLGLPAERLIWEGTTWPKSILSPMFCSSDKWHITNRRVDYAHGCCGNHLDTLDIRRITDLQFKRSCWQLMCCRGTLVIMSGDQTNPRIEITTFGMRDTFQEIKEAWLQARQTVAVDMDAAY
jgi:hypothetical protein